MLNNYTCGHKFVLSTLADFCAAPRGEERTKARMISSQDQKGEETQLLSSKHWGLLQQNRGYPLSRGIKFLGYCFVPLRGAAGCLTQTELKRERRAVRLLAATQAWVFPDSSA